MRITIFSLGGLLGQYVTNTALLHGAQVPAYMPEAKALWPRKNMGGGGGGGGGGGAGGRKRNDSLGHEAAWKNAVCDGRPCLHSCVWRLRGQIPENEYEIHADFLARCL